MGQKDPMSQKNVHVWCNTTDLYLTFPNQGKQKYNVKPFYKIDSKLILIKTNIYGGNVHEIQKLLKNAYINCRYCVSLWIII